MQWYIYIIIQSIESHIIILKSYTLLAHTISEVQWDHVYNHKCFATQCIPSPVHTLHSYNYFISILYAKAFHD